jgi:hypothetical protein
MSNAITDAVSTVRSTVPCSFGLVLTAGAGFWLQGRFAAYLHSYFFTNYPTVHRASSNLQRVYFGVCPQLCVRLVFGWAHIGFRIAVQQNEICAFLHVPQQPVADMICCSSVLQFSTSPLSLSLMPARSLAQSAPGCRCARFSHVVPTALSVPIAAPTAHRGQLQRAFEKGRWGRHAYRGGGGEAATDSETALLP